MRRTGKTTRQILDAPIGAVFICLNQTNVDDVRKLCSELCREDLILKSLSWLDSTDWRGRRFTGVILDHACWDTDRLSTTRFDNYMILRTRVKS